MSNSPKSCLWALKPGAENIAELAKTCPGRPVVTCPDWPGNSLSPALLTVCWCLNGPIMWNCANSSPSPRPFSIKTPSFWALWSTTSVFCVRYVSAGAPSLNYLVCLHQDGLSWFFGCTLSRDSGGGVSLQRSFNVFFPNVLICGW